MIYKLLMSILFILLVLSGCSNESDELYNSAIENGLDVLAAEDYPKAQVYFELAMAEKPEDTKAKSMLQQTTKYENALKLIEEKEYEEAIKISEEVINTEGGSSGLILKAEMLMKHIQKQIDEQQGTNAEDDNLEYADIVTNNEEENKEGENTGYTFEDFKGLYAGFESVPFESPIVSVVFVDDDFFIDGFISYDYSVRNFVNKEINENKLSFEYHITKNEFTEGSNGYLNLELNYENDIKSIKIIEGDINMYSVPENKIVNEGWKSPYDIVSSMNLNN